ncbi:MAG: Gfo/Idh/MocA family oxidoreductase [bacterium]|nr:Gfo/Idh/MocA family oxidoreductase [bacterium]
MERRDFLKSATSGVAAFTAASAQRVYGANSRINMALIGCGGRGTGVASFIRKAEGVEYTHLCDVYGTNLNRTKAAFGGKAKTYRDFRKLLEQKEIDAVHIGTPDHWHAIPTIMALEAGKHVYVEKPHGHNILEGQAMVKAAEQHPKLIFLTGTQHRSAAHLAEAAEMIQGGQIRDVHYVQVWNCYNCMPVTIGGAPNTDPPPDADWDFFLGPAPWVPFNKKRFVATYRFFTDYCGGWITDFGVHRFDSIHQIMGEDMPRTVNASGGRFAVRGAGDHPDVLQVTYEYPGFIMSYEALNTNGFGSMGRLTPGITHHSAGGKENRPNGMAFFGSNATLIVDRRGFELIPEEIPARRGLGIQNIKPDGPTLKRRAASFDEPTEEHAKHWVRCLRDGEKPRCDALVGHRGSNIAHLGNISYRVGRKLRWDGEKEVIHDDKQATKLMGREARKPWDMITTS